MNMANEALKEMKGMAPDQLKARESELRKELFELRNKVVSGAIKDRSDFANKTKLVKKDIARVHTILRQQETKK